VSFLVVLNKVSSSLNNILLFSSCFLGSSFLGSSFFGSSTIFFCSGFLGVAKTESEDSPNNPTGSATTLFFFCSFGGNFLGGGTSPKSESDSPLNRERGSLFLVVCVGAKLKSASVFGVVAKIFSDSFFFISGGTFF